MKMHGIFAGPGTVQSRRKILPAPIVIQGYSAIRVLSTNLFVRGYVRVIYDKLADSVIGVLSSQRKIYVKSQARRALK